jgi:DNA methylase
VAVAAAARREPAGEAYNVDLEASLALLERFPYQARPYAARNWGHPMHSLCSYPSKLKPGLAHFLVQLFSQPGEVVLDPFAGSGTVPFEAAQQGRRAIGADLSPFAARLTAAKVGPPTPLEVAQTLKQLESWIQETAGDVELASVEPEIVEFFHPETCREICAARDALEAEALGPPRARVLLWACLAHVLHGNRPYALSRRSHPIIPIPPKGAFTYKPVMKAVADKVGRLALHELPRTFLRGAAYEADAFAFAPPAASVDAIITSPPFLGTTEFLRQNRVRLWLAGMAYSQQAKDKPQFLEYERDLTRYRDLFVRWFNALRPGGRLVMHVGIVKNRDMAQELLPHAAEAGFLPLPIVREPAGHLESHGRTDRGATHTHEFLIAARP